MSRKDSPQSVIDSYRRRQQMAPYFMAGLAILLVIVGIIILVVWFTGSGGSRVSPIALFASATPTVTETATATPETPTATATSTATETVTPTITVTVTPSGPFEYTVQENDNCWDIAARHEVDITVLLALNNFGSGCPISPGDKILIPAADSELPTPTDIPSDLRGNVDYTVTFGDTLAIIASRFNSTIDAIMTQNKLENETINVGDVLKIPANIVTATPTLPPTVTVTPGGPTFTLEPSATETPQQ